MRKKRLRFGILGAGRMGTRHARIIAGNGGRVAAVCDVDAVAAKRLASLVECRRTVTRLEDLFDGGIDAVVIATPPSLRVPALLAAAESGAHVFVEKPGVLTLQDGRRCLAALERAGVHVAVGFQFRYAPVFERMKELLRDEPVHLIRSIGTESYYRTFYQPIWKLKKQPSGGVIAEQTSHLLDLARYLLGNAGPVRATGSGAKTMAHDRPDLDVENAFQVSYELEPHVFGVHSSHCGTGGYSIEMEVIGPGLRARNVGGGWIVGYRGERPFRERVAKRNSLGTGKLGAWLRALEEDDPSWIRSPFADSLQTVALCEAAEKGFRGGRFVAAEQP